MTKQLQDKFRAQLRKVLNSDIEIQDASDAIYIALTNVWAKSKAEERQVIYAITYYFVNYKQHLFQIYSEEVQNVTALRSDAL